MDSILQSLYNGQIFPAEQIRCHSPEYLALQDKITLERELLLQTLSQENCDRLELIEKLTLETMDMDGFSNFSYGLKTGLLLGLEISKEN